MIRSFSRSARIRTANVTSSSSSTSSSGASTAQNHIPAGDSEPLSPPNTTAQQAFAVTSSGSRGISSLRRVLEETTEMRKAKNDKKEEASDSESIGEEQNEKGPKGPSGWYSWMWRNNTSGSRRNDDGSDDTSMKKQNGESDGESVATKSTTPSDKGPETTKQREDTNGKGEDTKDQRSEKKQKKNDEQDDKKMENEQNTANLESKKDGDAVTQPQSQPPPPEVSSQQNGEHEATVSTASSTVKERASWYSLFKKNNNNRQQQPQSSESSDVDTDDQQPPTSSSKTWAFWSSTKNKNDGEMAITGEASEDHPKHAREPEFKEEQQKAPPKKQQKVSRRPNIVGPTADECFPVYTQTRRLKSSMRKLSEYIAPALKNPAETHLHDPLYRTSPKMIHKTVVIGVHGFFPARVVRSILGEPTGTSIKFANEGAAAVQRWADEKGFKVEIEKIALEGEGKVMNRVEKLYTLLQNWISHIHDADFIFFAAHSQGTPVAVHLLARLVEEGHVERKQIALLGMAGISLGPMSGLDQKLVMRAYSSIESDSLSELFQFQDPDSFQSRKYLDSLRTIIEHNSKIVFIGSMNDQLVPLYSSTCIHLSHPNIYRAVYVDGQDVAPEFISTLVTLALRLRNIGSSDHGVIKEISGALSGTLTGGGHSKIYDEGRVYDLSIRHALETTDPGPNVPVKLSSDFKVPKSNNNPYLLPWCMRGLLSEALTRESLAGHLNELYNEFEQWKPETKILKDMKYRLSAIQSKL
ncbi:hypothetical protein TRICI_001600 [Trichomonascus ciferrii]|uniref:YMC020W-like alpha/beta hydrolase domain-containing protein n=1 Tax=Trichomonascus ciferrii TaxID=44093 RepID=A0A642V8U3_9ASCO|nr:hypothetical protein TRICI_001600 [Trichomonascus ciferrii]